MKILIIGGGIGGYVCAIRSAQLGNEVNLVERKHIGGTCLNEGCIPTKAILESAEFYQNAREADVYSVNVEGVSLDYQGVIERKNAIVDQLVSGVRGLLRKNKVRLIEGEAKIIDGHRALIEGEELAFDSIVIASGSKPVVLPIEGIDLEGVIDSTKALTLDRLPQSIAIIGGGVIGVEFASFFHAFGAEVTIIEMMDRLVPPLDQDISQNLKEVYEKRGIAVHNSAKVLKIEKSAKGLKVYFEKAGQKQAVEAETVLVATGRAPVTDVIDQAEIKPEMNRRFIAIDENYRTSVDGLYAIGDVTGKSMLAHSAEEMGLRCADILSGRKPRPIDYQRIPSCLYTNPEAASVGLTQVQAEEAGYKVAVGIFPLMANARTLILNQSANSFAKIVCDKETKEILGVHLFGPFATEMIAEASLAMELECTAQEIADTIHPHPTVSEAIKEAASSLLDGAIHF